MTVLLSHNRGQSHKEASAALQKLSVRPSYDMAELGALICLPAFTDEGLLNAVIETPMGARNKFTYDEKLGLFRLKKVLPVGHVFPFHFGFIPSTWADDDGPLDVLILMEEPAFPGCLVEARLLGAVEARQTKNARKVRNDRLIAVADKMPSLGHYRNLKDVPDSVLSQIEHFFISYNKAEGKMFTPLGRADAKAAKELVHQGEKKFLRKLKAK
jgi:inorganic pyrophosphatase